MSESKLYALCAELTEYLALLDEPPHELVNRAQAELAISPVVPTYTWLPSYRLVQRLMYESGFDISDPDDEMLFPAAKFMKLASRLIQHGADEELEACLYWVGDGRRENLSQVIGLRTARRPKPPSKAESALNALEHILRHSQTDHGASTIRLALEHLKKLEESTND